MAIQPATKTTLGGVKIGNGINITSDGTISIGTKTLSITMDDIDVTEEVDIVINEELISILNDIVENPTNKNLYTLIFTDDTEEYTKQLCLKCTACGDASMSISGTNITVYLVIFRCNTMSSFQMYFVKVQNSSTWNVVITEV